LDCPIAALQFEPAVNDGQYFFIVSFEFNNCICVKAEEMPVIAKVIAFVLKGVGARYFSGQTGTPIRKVNVYDPVSFLDIEQEIGFSLAVLLFFGHVLPLLVFDACF
jgi:hypothetical protein